MRDKRPWWVEHDEKAAPPEHGFAFPEALSPAMRALLQDVEMVFQATGGGSLAWPNPHRDRDSSPDEYCRIADPGKYRILVDRVWAWVAVLVARGWATARDWAEWADLRLAQEYQQAVLEPVAEGAVPLAFAITVDDPEIGHRVVVGAGDPVVVLYEPRECGCDACDDGSEIMLQDLDQWALSVVDGSLIVDGGPDAPTIDSSFAGRTVGGTPGQNSRGAPKSFTAGPWAEGWMPRTVERMRSVRGV